jgi:hypothetical protein
LDKFIKNDASATVTPRDAPETIQDKTRSEITVRSKASEGLDFSPKNGKGSQSKNPGTGTQQNLCPHLGCGDKNDICFHACQTTRATFCHLILILKSHVSGGNKVKAMLGNEQSNGLIDELQY